MTVALPSEPANYFHLLRRHTLDGVRRPLVVFTPKWMLRAKQVVSPLSDFTGGRFRPVIDDPRVPRPGRPERLGVRKVLLCSGKIYWELAAARDKREGGDVGDTAIVRVEQLYPMPVRQLAAVLDRYPNAEDVRWVQEEPANQGAWPYYGLELPREAPGPAGPVHPGLPAADGGPGRRLVQGARGRAAGTGQQGVRGTEREACRSRARYRATSGRGRRGSSATGLASLAGVYFTDRGIEELVDRRGEEQVSSSGWPTGCARSST